jgi:hypothetical protein
VAASADTKAKAKAVKNSQSLRGVLAPAGQF